MIISSPSAGRDRRNDKQLPAVQISGTAREPRVNRQQHDGHYQPDAGSISDGDAPASRATTSATSGMQEKLTIGHVPASAERISGHVGNRPPASCSPRIFAYSSASQYTTSVTRMQTDSGWVGR